ncbi:hypothetical protein PtA15_8A261 [Puccinia triticina]|uniref:Uncharacterized protein n=1 Tax=Puccinia triticina TaxID=208348 RepID=A0ABY7CXA8_9BASI|nr:uncharacterized protein PtA15_8A261 [Puccinia triticina]WAQ87357.1 hypothetical protein PtA15_8A261 [Puccinia triticina]
MDSSHNAWASSTSVPPTVRRTKKKSSTTADNSQAALIEKLAREIKTLKTNLNLKKSASKSKGKSPANSAAHDSGPSSSSAPAAKTKAPAPTTPKRNQRATSAPFKFMGPPKPRKSIPETPAAKPSPKRHPQQMQTGDFPAAFGPTKTALFVHIKILWDLLKQDLVPRPPELSTLEGFYRRFRRAEQIEEAVRSGSASRDVTQVLCLRDAQGGRIQYRKLIIHLGSNFVCYAQGILAQLGLSVWCPNLDEDSASLYNAAHRIAALTTFTKLAATPAYAYLKINPVMAQDMTLLVRAYNHFVHYLQAEKYKKEMKEEGKVAQEANNKKFNKNRERLRDARRDFAILNKYPKRYRDILEPISAHSNDEKTLPYRSNNANRFFQRLDIVMMKAAEQDPLAKSSRRRVRRLRRVPQESSYKAAPKGLPIYFYHPTWFNDLVPAQQHSIPDRTRIAFLPNSSESLLPKAKRHPDENSADSTFTKKYWEVVVEPYGLLNVESSEEEEFAAETQGAGQDKEGEGIDLTQPSKGSDSDNKYHVEGDAGDLYDEEGEDDSSVDQSNRHEDDDKDDGDDEDDDKYYDKAQGGGGLDGDHAMNNIPECKEEW